MNGQRLSLGTGSWRDLFALGLAVGWLFSIHVFGSAQAPADADDESSQEDLPLFSEMPLPSFEQLNTGKALDWVLLKSGRVLVVEPLYPRPGVLQYLEEEVRKLVNARPTREDLQGEWRRRREELNFLPVTLPDPELESAEFLLETKLVEKVLYFEDLLLLKVEELKTQSRWAEAFDLLSRTIARDVSRINFDAGPGRQIRNLEEFFKSKTTWPGLQDSYARLLMDEAKALSGQRRFEGALARLDELRSIKADAPTLQETTASVTRDAINFSISRNDYVRARFYLNRLRGMYPQDPLISAESGKLLAQAQTLMAEGVGLYNSGDPAQGYLKLTLAMRVWPETPNLVSAFRRESSRYQILKSGVFSIPQERSILPYKTLDQQRLDDLTREPFFRPHDFQNQAVLFSSAYLEDWVPTDLGREYELVLKTDRQPFETTPLFDAQELARAIRPLITPGSSRYNERLASFIEHVEPLDVQRVRLSLSQIPVAPEATFSEFLKRLSSDAEMEPVELASAGEASDLVRLDYSSRAIANERFRLVGEIEGRRRYVRSRPESGDSLDFHVAEIQEVLVSTPLEGTQLMKSGEIDMMPDVSAYQVEQFQEDGKFFVQTWGLPKTSVLQFHLDSPFFQRPVLRRVLQYAIPRERLLSELLEVENVSRYARLVSGPAASSSSSYNKLVPLAPYSPATSLALLLTTQGANAAPLPKLRLLVPNQTQAIKICQGIASSWTRLGLEVEVIRDDGQHTAPVSYDVVYRELRMNEPLTELWPVLTMKDRAELNDLMSFPSWLRVKLLNLEKASDRATAERLARELHQDLAREVFIIPLWEVDQFAVFGNHVQGFRLQPLTPYQQLERWSLRPRILSINP